MTQPGNSSMPCKEAEAEFREAMVVLVRSLPDLPPAHWPQFQSEVEQLLGQPTLFEEFVSCAPSPAAAILLRQAQSAYHRWMASESSPRAGDGKDAGISFPKGQPVTPKQQTALRQQALAVAYAHRVRERFAGSPEQYARFVELVSHYEEQRESNDAVGEMGDILNAALLNEVSEQLAAVFGEQHSDLVHGFREHVHSACVASGAAAAASG